MLDENNYPTMKFMRCKKCGNVFAASMTGYNECPECASEETGLLAESQDNENEKET